MKYKTITIDCDGMTKTGLNQTMKDLLGFPDFYGMNWDAMIDCLSYMRFPEAGMSKITLEHDEMLIVNCKHLAKAEFDMRSFVDVIEAVNEREISYGGISQILLHPIP